VESEREGAASHNCSEGEFLRDPEGKVLCRTHRHQEIRLIASLQIHSRSAALRGLNDIIPNSPAVKPFFQVFLVSRHFQ